MSEAATLSEFLDRSPTAFHAVDQIASMLDAAGALELREGGEWKAEPGTLHYVRRGGTSLIAFRTGFARAAERGFAIAGAHTDSPCLKLRPGKELMEGGLLRLGVEPYGGPILSTWTDRPLGLSGRVVIRGAKGLESRLVRSPEPVGVIPSLAIHLNREVNKGFEYNAQSHLPVLVGASAKEGLAWLPAALSTWLGIDAKDMMGFDLYFDERAPSFEFGPGLLNAPRADDLSACHAILGALIAAEPSAHGQIAVFFDHEEIGSNTRTGADGSLLRDTLERLVATGSGGGREDFWRAAASSFSVSIDVAQGFHPSYPEKFDDSFAPLLNAGPAIKSSANMSYATTGATAAAFAALAATNGIPLQTFMTRSDIRPGSTIGPMSSALSGIRTVDIGAPLLSMHASRETIGLKDHEWLGALALACYREGPSSLE